MDIFFLTLILLNFFKYFYIYCLLFSQLCRNSLSNYWATILEIIIVFFFFELGARYFIWRSVFCYYSLLSIPLPFLYQRISGWILSCNNYYDGKCENVKMSTSNKLQTMHYKKPECSKKKPRSETSTEITDHHSFEDLVRMVFTFSGTAEEIKQILQTVINENNNKRRNRTAEKGEKSWKNQCSFYSHKQKNGFSASSGKKWQETQSYGRM